LLRGDNGGDQLSGHTGGPLASSASASAPMTASVSASAAGSPDSSSVPPTAVLCIALLMLSRPNAPAVALLNWALDRLLADNTGGARLAINGGDVSSALSRRLSKDCPRMRLDFIDEALARIEGRSRALRAMFGGRRAVAAALATAGNSFGSFGIGGAIHTDGCATGCGGAGAGPAGGGAGFGGARPSDSGRSRAVSPDSGGTGGGGGGESDSEDGMAMSYATAHADALRDHEATLGALTRLELMTIMQPWIERVSFLFADATKVRRLLTRLLDVTVADAGSVLGERVAALWGGLAASTENINVIIDFLLDLLAPAILYDDDGGGGDGDGENATPSFRAGGVSGDRANGNSYIDPDDDDDDGDGRGADAEDAAGGGDDGAASAAGSVPGSASAGGAGRKSSAGPQGSSTRSPPAMAAGGGGSGAASFGAPPHAPGHAHRRSRYHTERSAARRAQILMVAKSIALYCSRASAGQTIDKLASEICLRAADTTAAALSRGPGASPGPAAGPSTPGASEERTVIQRRRKRLLTEPPQQRPFFTPLKYNRGRRDSVSVTRPATPGASVLSSSAGASQLGSGSAMDATTTTTTTTAAAAAASAGAAGGGGSDVIPDAPSFTCGRRVGPGVPCGMLTRAAAAMVLLTDIAYERDVELRPYVPTLLHCCVVLLDDVSTAGVLAGHARRMLANIIQMSVINRLHEEASLADQASAAAAAANGE
jgi:hypothetical protein